MKKKIILLITLVLLLVGISYASDVSNDTTTTTIKDTYTNIEKETSTSKIVDNIIKEETKTNKEITKQNIENKTTKTASKTYDVTNFDTLHNALTTNTYDTVTINIKSNIKLTGEIQLNESINKLILNGNGKTINGNSNRFLKINSNTVEMNNVIIIKCSTAGEGGVIFNNKGTLTITHSILNNNHATLGGVIENYYGTLTIAHSQLINNYAYGGGAIDNRYGKLNITNTTIKNNKVMDGDGGAIYNMNGTISIINTPLNNNEALEGGAIYNREGTIDIINSTLINNKVEKDFRLSNDEAHGGAIYNEKGILNIWNTKLINHNATKGGAIYNEKGILNIQNSELINHNATNGGAIYNDGDLTIIQSTLKNNNATYGGVMYNDGDLTIIQSTLNKNIASSGGVIYNYGRVILTNNILNYNKAYFGGVIYNNRLFTLNNCILNNNNAVYGGSVFNSATLTIVNSTLNNNNAFYGGSLHNSEELDISNSTLSNNKAEFDGGAIENYNGNNIKIFNNNFINNSAYYGAAIMCDGQISSDVSDGYNINITIQKNNFFKNSANTSGKAIINKGKKTTIKNNKYDDISVDSSTIHIVNTTNSKIIDNIFDDGKNTIITLENNKTVYLGRQTTIYGKLSFNGKGLAYQKVIITVDGKKYNTNTTKYGNYNFKITPTTTGTKNITVTFKGTNKYNSAYVKSTFTVKKSTSITISNKASVYVGTQIGIYGKLTSNNKSIANQKITIKVDGKTYYTNTTKYGNYKLIITPLTQGTKSITVAYPGTNIYDYSYTKSTFIVYKKSTTVTVSNKDSVYVGNQIGIYGKLTSNNKSVANQKITIKVDGKTYYTNTTKYGNYKLIITPTTTGTKEITVNYGGSSNYASSSSTSMFNVMKNPTQITLNNIPDVSYGSVVTISGYYYYGNNIPLTSTSMTLNINGEKYTIKTDSKGLFTYNYKTDRIGKNTVTVSYPGNNNFKAASTTKTFNVKVTSPISTYIYLHGVNEVEVGESTMISGSYFYGNGYPLTQTTMTIEINGQKYFVKTDNQGDFTYNYKTDKTGTNTVTVSYPGNSNFKSASARVTFNVKIKEPEYTYIMLNNIQEVEEGKYTTISGYYYYGNNIPLTQTTMIITVNGQKYTTKTDNTGYFRYDYKTNKVGTNTVTVSYPGNNNFKQASATTTFTTKYPTLEMNLYRLVSEYPTQIQVGSDIFSAWYQDYDAQYDKGAHVEVMGYDSSTDSYSAPHYALVDAVFFFKNSEGDIFTDSDCFSYYYSYIGHNWVYGYTPYKVIVSYRKATEDERKYW